MRYLQHRRSQQNKKDNDLLFNLFFTVLLSRILARQSDVISDVCVWQMVLLYLSENCHDW